MEVTVEGVRLVADEFEGYPRRAQSAIVRALNRGGDAGRTFMARAIAKDVGMKVGDVTKALRHRKASANDPAVEIAAGFKRIPLMAFGAKGPYPSLGRGRGVSYRMGTGNPRSRVASAFIVKLRSGHEGVFIRKTRKRLPIVQLFGPSLGKVFGKYRPDGQARAVEAFTITLDHELDRLQARG